MSLPALARSTALALVLAATACSHPVAADSAVHLTGTSLPPVPAPPLALREVDGKPFDLAQERGRTFVFFFGYTHCPDVCPTTLADLARAVRSLPPAERARVDVAMVTVDPARDGAARLGAYVHQFDPRFFGLTGTSAELDRALAAYHGWRQRLPGTSAAGYAVAHGSSVYVIDAEGRLREMHDANDAPADIAADLRSLAS